MPRVPQTATRPRTETQFCEASPFCNDPPSQAQSQTLQTSRLVANLRNWLNSPMIRFVALLLCFVQTAFSVEIIAHRGASSDAPENTLSAMKLAWEQNADAIELDLWLSKDGRLVVFHDADAKRIAGVPRKVADLTWAEVQQLDAGAWKSPRFTGERVPNLESILATVPKGGRAVLEIKCGPEIVPELKRVLDASQR